MAMIVLFMLAGTALDGDAMILIVLGLPALLILWILMGWAKASDDEFFRREEESEM